MGGKGFENHGGKALEIHGRKLFGHRLKGRELLLNTWEGFHGQ